MIEIRIHDHAKDDIRDSSRFSGKDRAYLRVLFSEMRDNPDVQDALLIHDETVSFGVGDDTANIQKWWEQFRYRNRDLWRLKPLTHLNGRSMKFRVIYAYRPAYQGVEPEIWILGVFRRNEFDYEESNPLTQRVIEDYENLD